MRIVLVHSPGAGDARHDPASLVALVRAHGHVVNYFESTEDWRRAVDARVDLVVAVGGDGTVADVAKHLAGGTIPIAVLPLGTANNVANALGLASTPLPQLVENWTHGKRQPFDMGRARSSDEDLRFFESVGVGLIAESIAEIAHGGAGHVDDLDVASERMDAALVVLREMLSAIDAVHVDLRLDDEDASGEYLLLEVMNFGWAGPNLSLVPDAVPDDGAFNIVWAEERHREQLAGDLLRYRHGQRPLVSLPVCTAREVRMSCQKGRLHLDDQLRRGPARLHLSIEPHAVTFVV